MAATGFITGAAWMLVGVLASRLGLCRALRPVAAVGAVSAIALVVLATSRGG